MAIDSSLFMADIPAGTYAKGDKITLSIKAGPAVVRSGRGQALLKRVTVGIMGTVSGSGSSWRIRTKNSDWVDEMVSLVAPISAATVLDERSGSVQRGNDCPLTQNSSWEVVAECLGSATTTVGNTLFALIDIDYPSVSSIVDPDALPGIPATIVHDYANPMTTNALGSSANATWNVQNVDMFKAGYEYALQKIESDALAGSCGFVALSNAAGMAGLTRIIPIASDPANIRNKVEYATKLVKGPLDIQMMLFANSGTAGSATPRLLLDFVKRKVA